MKRIQSILVLTAIGLSITSCSFQMKSPSLADNSDVAHIQMSINSTWLDISKKMDELLKEGYLKIQINDFHYEYHGPFNEGAENQKSDPILVDATNLDPLCEWCSKHHGKIIDVSIGDRVTLPTVEKICRMLNERGFIYYFRRESADNTKIKIDLYNRHEDQNQKSPNQRVDLARPKAKR